jgi:hypothetical protein
VLISLCHTASCKQQSQERTAASHLPAALIRTTDK